jgi:hypothetical protein
VRVCSITLTCVAVSCAHVEPPPPQQQTLQRALKALPAEDPAATAVRSVIAQVAEIRHLREKTPLSIDVVEPEEIRNLLAKSVDKDATPEEMRAEQARWLVFGFTDAPLDAHDVIMRTLQEQVVAFYDPDAHVLHVPKHFSLPAGGVDPAAASASLLAHEIEHGLQDQHFPIFRIKMPDDDDSELARHAAAEGDATFVMIAQAAARQNGGRSMDIVTVARQLEKLSPEAMLEMSGQSKEALKAPRLMQEELLFPYIAGLRLVAELYHAGGYDLVDRMLQSPPASSKQVLHPEAYVAGVLPVPIEDASPPPGETVVAKGRLGELGIRAMFSGCLGSQRAAQTAAGWAGDGYLITKDTSDLLDLQWSTAWDTKEEAARFGAALRELQACWQRTQALPATGLRASPHLGVLVRGTRVSVVRGPRDQDRRLKPLLALIHHPVPPVPPIGDVQLDFRPVQADWKPPVMEHPRVDPDGTWTASWYGLTSAVPAGYTAIDLPDALLFLKGNQPADGTGMIVFVPTALDESGRDGFFRGLAGQFAASAGHGAKLSDGGALPVKLAGVPGVQRRWRMEGTPFELVASVIPICESQAAVALVVFATPGTPAGDALDGWRGSLRRLPDAPVCDALRGRRSRN